MNKPHKHAEVIKAWADGAEIEYYCHIEEKWLPIDPPLWHTGNNYRIKPAEPKVTKMYMHYGDIETAIKRGHFNEEYVPQIMYNSNTELGKHIEFTFIDDELISVELKNEQTNF